MTKYRKDFLTDDEINAALKLQKEEAERLLEDIKQKRTAIIAISDEFFAQKEANEKEEIEKSKRQRKAYAVLMGSTMFFLSLLIGCGRV